jgi:hypothetical protein
MLIAKTYSLVQNLTYTFDVNPNNSVSVEGRRGFGGLLTLTRGESEMAKIMLTLILDNP